MNIASIDIGTNTILLIIAEVVNGCKKITPILNEYRIPRIGKGLTPGGEINLTQAGLLFNVLDEYSDIITRYKCEKVLATATNAFRISSNGKTIADEIYRKYNFKVNIISGKDEAKLSYLGAVSDWTVNDINLVIDIGGGSTELVLGNGNQILSRESYQAGVVSGTESFFHHDPPIAEEIDKFINELEKIFIPLKSNEIKADNILAIAGTPTTLACLKQNLSVYDENQIEGSSLSYEEIGLFVKELSSLRSSQILTKYNAIVKGREDILLCGTIILYTLMRILRLKQVKVSAKGIRYGAIVNYLMEESY